MGGEFGEAVLDLDSVGLVADEGGHAGGDAEAGAPFAEEVSTEEAGVLESGEGGVDFFGIAGEVARVTAVEAGVEEGITALLGLGEEGADVRGDFAGFEGEGNLFEGHCG